MSALPVLAHMPSPVARAGQGPLSRKAKAAIIVQFLLNEGSDVPLSSLSDETQTELTLLMGNMRYVDRETLNQVVTEFSDELESVGLSFPGGMSSALDALEGKLNPRTAQRLRKEAGVRHSGDPWDRINSLEPEHIASLVQGESIEVAAVMMSKIDVGKAADVIASMPGDKARRISLAVSLTTGVTPDAVDRIGLSLAAQLDAMPPKAFKARPDQRLGAILNYSTAATRDELLQKLEEDDRDFAEAVRRAIFTYENIPERINPGDVPKITRDVPAEALAMALAAAQSDADRATNEFLLNNMSRRLADSLRDEAGELGTVKPRQGERAMSSVVAAIRELIDAGEIELRSPDDE